MPDRLHRLAADLMNKSFIELATPGVQGLTPYQPGKPVEELERELGIQGAIKLASNENPLGPGARAVAAMRERLTQVSDYPDGGGYALSARIARVNRVEAACVTLGNGSNDILELVTRAYLGRDDSAVFSEYSFAVYPIVVQAVGATAKVAAAFDEDHPAMPLGHDPDALVASIDERTRIVFIANPNNPTGTWLTPDQLHGLLERIAGDIIVVLDLAYLEYMEDELQPDCAALLQRYPNLVITRTFSKVHGLAGLRIGYSLSHPDIANVLNRVRQPFNTNLLAQSAALATLDDEEHLQRSVAMNREGRHLLTEAFEAMGLSVLPSMGNFLAVKVRQDGQAMYQRLLRSGVIVRPVANYAMPDYLRVTVGTGEQNQRLLDAFDACLAERD